MQFIVKTLQCERCKTVREILRKKARNRSIGHCKHMRCFNCGKTTKHIER
jgi:hypothetical protein